MTEMIIAKMLTATQDEDISGDLQADPTVQFAHVLLCAGAQRFGELLKNAEIDLADITYILDCLTDGISWVRDVTRDLTEKIAAPHSDSVLHLRRACDSMEVTSHLLGTANSHLLAVTRRDH